MSREERRRLEATEGAAKQAGENATKALGEIANHAGVCTERHKNIDAKLNSLDSASKDNERWNRRLALGIVTLLLGVIAQLLHGKGFW